MNWKPIATVSGVVTGLLPALGCEAPVEDADEEVTAQAEALTTTQTVTPGQCATTVNFDKTAAGGFTASCSSKCLNDTTVTLRFYIEQFNGTSWPSVSFGGTGFASKLGGSATTAYPNASPGRYRAHCWVDYSDPNRAHFYGDVYSPEIEQLRTSDVTPPTVTMTSPVDGSVSSGAVTVTANATDNVAVQKVQFYRKDPTGEVYTVGAPDTATPYTASTTVSHLPEGSYVYYAVATDAMGNTSTSAPVTVRRPAACVATTTCASAGKNCGYVTNDCGGQLYCGGCLGTETCGGAGIPNVCGMPPTAAITLTVSGRSGERVTSNPAGLSVATGASATKSFPSGSSVTLTVSNGRPAIFSGACSSNGAKVNKCTFTARTNASVSANIQ